MKFRIGNATSLGTINVNTPTGDIIFHVVPAETQFFLSLQDLDGLKVRFDNLDNVLIQNGKRIPFFRAYGHPLMLLNEFEALAYQDHSMVNNSNNTFQLTEVEIKRLQRRFGYHSAGRLVKVLKRAGYEANFKEIEKLTKHCEDRQTHGKASDRFKFTLKDDNDFNHTIYIYLLFLDGYPVILIVDDATNLHFNLGNI